MRQDDETGMGQMKFPTVESWVKPDTGVGRNGAPPISDNAPQPRMRADVHVVQNDTLFQLRASFNAHASADDRLLDVGIDTPGSMPDHRLVDVRPDQHGHGPIILA